MINYVEHVLPKKYLHSVTKNIFKVFIKWFIKKQTINLDFMEQSINASKMYLNVYDLIITLPILKLNTGDNFVPQT